MQQYAASDLSLHCCTGPLKRTLGLYGLRKHKGLDVRKPGLENSTRPLVYTSVSGCRASEYFDISTENQIFPMYANKFGDARQVPIFRYFEA